jgi:hypothetical protein
MESNIAKNYSIEKVSYLLLWIIFHSNSGVKKNENFWSSLEVFAAGSNEFLRHRTDGDFVSVSYVNGQFLDG